MLEKSRPPGWESVLEEGFLGRKCINISEEQKEQETFTISCQPSQEASQSGGKKVVNQWLRGIIVQVRFTTDTVFYLSS